ncbi:dehypoxanthine futalosine cyclase, partial [bacterium]|nr:dehypoxanthine futalosine cyclase [bacterium]
MGAAESGEKKDSLQPFSADAISTELVSSGSISSGEALELYEHSELAQLGVLAHNVRQEKVPGDAVTYLIDRNINYTNVCNSDCSFCGFYRPRSDHPESYLLTRDELRVKIE